MARGSIFHFIFFLALLVALIIFEETLQELIFELDVAVKFQNSFLTLVKGALSIMLISSALQWWYQKKRARKAVDALILGIRHVTSLILIAITIALILAVFNIGMKEAITSLSLIAVAVVLITKDYIANIINGMILTFSPNVNIDDFVKIGNQKGKVIDMTLTNLQLLSDDDDVIFIPNNVAYNSEIVNYSRREIKKSSIEFSMNPALYPDIDDLLSQIVKKLGPLADQMEADSLILKIVKAEFDQIGLKFQYILKDPSNKKLELEIRRIVMRRLMKLLYEPRDT